MESSTLSRISFFFFQAEDGIRDGKIVWSIDDDNLVVNTGLEYAMHRIFGDEEKAEWRIGLCTNANSSPGDTAESHEFIEYMGTTNDRRPVAEFEDGGVDVNKYTYVATDVQAMITGTETLVGIFMTTGMMKGVDDGTLYGVASFSEPKNVVPGDALLITVTVSAKG